MYQCDKFLKAKCGDNYPHCCVRYTSILLLHECKELFLPADDQGFFLAGCQGFGFVTQLLDVASSKKGSGRQITKEGILWEVKVK